MVKLSETSKDNGSRKRHIKSAKQGNPQKSCKTLAAQKETLQNIDSVVLAKSTIMFDRFCPVVARSRKFSQSAQKINPILNEGGGKCPLLSFVIILSKS